MSSALFACLLTIFSAGDAARILAVFPTPSISHQVVFRPLVQELAKLGHDLIVITADPAFPKGKAPGNLTEIDMHDFSYKIWRDNFLVTSSTANNDLATQIKVGFKLMSGLFFEQMQTSEVQEILNDKTKPFDLLLIEAMVRPAVALTHVVKAPTIQVSSLGAVIYNYEDVGAPLHPILYPQFLRQRLYNLSAWEKLKEFYYFYKFTSIFRSMEAMDHEKCKQIFGPDIPSIRELASNVDMLFLNINPIWEGNHPVPPNVVHLGGLHQRPQKELPKDLQNYLDLSTNGVIYISFGTNVNPSHLPQDIIKIFLNVFSKLPYNVLWKWDQDELRGKPDNVKISKWLPQSDLLRHKNVKVFITQGGLQSTDEAITAGVPLIGIPMLGDQWYNTEKYAHHGIGIKIDMSTLTEKKLRDGIERVIEDKSYSENLRRLRTLMGDQPMKPLERAMWWIEYVLRHGGAKHLRSPGANISWTEYLELKLVATLLLFILGVILFISYILNYLVKFSKCYTLNVKTKSS